MKQQVVSAALLFKKLAPIKGANFTGREGFSLRQIADAICARARPRGFCLSGYALKQKHRCGLQIPTRQEAACVTKLRICLPVKFLAEFSCRPGSRYSPLPDGKTRTSLCLSNPDAIPSSWYRSTLHKFKTPRLRGLNLYGEGGI